MIDSLRRVVRDDDGQDLIEYALLGACIAIIVMMRHTLEGALTVWAQTR